MQELVLKALQKANEYEEKTFSFCQEWLKEKNVFILPYEDWEGNKIYRLPKPANKSENFGAFIDVLIDYQPYTTKGCKGLIFKKEGKLFVCWTIPVRKTKTYSLEGLKEFIPLTEEEIERNKVLRKEEEIFDRMYKVIKENLRTLNSIDSYKEINEEMKTVLSKVL